MRKPASDEPSTATQSPPPRRIRRWLRRIFIAVPALALASIVIALVVLHTDWGRTRVRLQALRALAEVFPGGFELDRLEGSVLGTVSVRGVVIYDQNRRRAVAVERASFDIGLVALLRHTIRLERLDIEGLTVAAFDDGQALNLTTLVRPRQSDSASTWRVQIDDVRLARGSVALTRPSADSPGQLVSDHFDDIAVRGTAAIDPRGPMTSSVMAGLRWRERNVTAELRAGVRLSGGVVEVSRADARVGNVRAVVRELRFASPATVAGSLEVTATEGSLRELIPTLPANPATTLTIKVQPQTGDALRVTLNASSGEARLSGDVTVKPLLARPQATGELQLHHVEPAALLGSHHVRALSHVQLLRASFAFDLAAARESFSLDSIAATVRGSAEISDRSGSPAPLTLEAHVQNRRLTATATGSLGTSRLSATVDVTVDEKQRLQVHEARLRGHLAAKDIPTEIDAAPTIAGVIDIDLHAQGNVDLGSLTSPEVPVPPASSVASAAPTVPTTPGRRPGLTITGIVDGSGLRFAGYAADRLYVELSPAVFAAWPRGNIRATLTGISADGQRMPNLEVRAASAATGVVDVDVHARGWSDTPSPSRRSPPSDTATLLAEFGNTGALDVSASIHPDRGYRGANITLRNFRAALRGVEVTAKTGQLSLRPSHQEVRGLRLRSNAGTIAIDGVRAGRNVTASIAIDQLELSPLAAVAPQLAGLQGRVKLRGAVSWRGNALEATVRGQIAQLVARPGAAPIDADLMASATPRRLHAELQAKSARIGEILVGADIAPPADLASRAAWQALDRRSLRRLSIHSDRLDLGALQHVVGPIVSRTELATTPAVVGKPTAAGGNSTAAAENPTAADRHAALDGRAAIDLELTPAGGTLRATVAELSVPGSPAAMDVLCEGEFDADGKGDLRATVRIATITATATAALRIPTRPFGLAAWSLTPERITRVALEVPRFAITDSLAGRLGLGNWRGQASASFDLQLDVNKASGRIALVDVRGGPLQRSVEIVADLTTDAGVAHLIGEGKIDGIPAVALAVDLPLPSFVDGTTAGTTSAARWVDLPLKGEVRFGPVPAATIARLLGTSTINSRRVADSTNSASSVATPRDASPLTTPRDATPLTTPRDATTQTTPRDATTRTTPDQRAGASAVRPPSRLQGTVRGDITFAGTIRAPDLKLDLEIVDLGSQRNKIRELRLVGRYAAGAVHGELSGANDKTGRLRGLVDFDIAKPADARITVSASDFELSPLARLVPTALLGVTARLDGALDARGLDPKQMQVAGNLTLSDVRLPLANQVGALTNATIRITLGAGRLTAGLQGDIEAGKVTATASAALDGIVPRSGTLDLALSDLALIAPMTPTVGGKLHVDARVVNGRWNLAARLTDGLIRIPAEEGRVLHPITPPTDVVFVDNARNVQAPPRHLTPSPPTVASRTGSPWLEIALAIESVTVRTAEATGTVRGKIDLDIADTGLSTTGIIRLTGGDVLLFGRRYQIARAALTFDGPLDPTVDAELRHDFPQLTLTAMITGRTSKPQFHFRSSPSDYTEAQLLSFFLGGNPSASGRDVEVANSVAAAVASQTLGAMVTRQLPVRLDVLSYQPQTTSSSGALVAGRWITDQLLLLVRNRTNPRPLENGAEGELQYWLRRGLLLDGVAGDRGTLGLDLLWNRRW